MEPAAKRAKTGGATKHCAHGTCNSDSRYPDRPGMENVFFMRFPKPKKDYEKCVRWAKACGRVGFDEANVKKDTYICSKHFVGDFGPSVDHPDPIPANATNFEVARYKKTPRRKLERRAPLSPLKLEEVNVIEESRKLERRAPLSPLKLEEVCVIEESHAQDPPSTTRKEKEEIADILLTLSNSLPDTETSNCNKDVDDVNAEQTASLGCGKCLFTARKLVDQCSNTETNLPPSEVAVRIRNKLLENEVGSLQFQLEMEQAKSKKNKEEESVTVNVRLDFDISQLDGDDERCRYFTGLSYAQLMQLWAFIEPQVQYLQYWNRTTCKKTNYKTSPQNALVMTLMRLRVGYTNQDLAYRFGTNVTDVSNILLTWIQFLYQQFKPLKGFMFAERSVVRETMPPSFKKYKNIRCIIDCTEFFCQRPGNFERQGNLYSSYKAHTTYKILVAIAPNGAIMFVSDAAEGSMSDRQITIDSGFLDHINPGDTVMADRGFNIKDLLHERKASLIIPPFLNGRERLTDQEEYVTKDIAKHRIHVERVIERMKKYKILQKTIPLTMEPVLTQVVFIVGCLVNFQEPIVK